MGQPVVIENRTGARGQHRHRRGRARGARRLHDPVQHDERAHDEPRAHRRHAVRRREGFLADHAARLRDQHDGGASVGAGEHRAGVHRLREGQPRQDQLRVVRSRARPIICVPRCWRRWPASRCCTCRIAAARRRSPTRSAGRCSSSSPPARRAWSTSRPGRLKLLGVTEAKRSPFLPDVPTVGETVPGYEMTVWYGAFGPPGMPKDIVAKLNSEIARTLFHSRREEAHGRHRGRARVIDAGRTCRAHAHRCREVGRHHQEHRDHAAVACLSDICVDHLWQQAANSDR